MRRYAPVASTERPAEPQQPQQAERKDVYRWALGTQPSGQPQSSPHVQAEPDKIEPDLYEIARMIRGEK